MKFSRGRPKLLIIADDFYDYYGCIAKYFILHYIQIVENISFFMYICNMLFESKGILTFAS